MFSDPPQLLLFDIQPLSIPVIYWRVIFIILVDHSLRNTPSYYETTIGAMFTFKLSTYTKQASTSILIAYLIVYGQTARHIELSTVISWCNAAGVYYNNKLWARRMIMTSR